MLRQSLFLRIFTLLWAGILVTGQTALAGNFAVDVDGKGIALKGHDPIAYFADGKKAMGSADYSAGFDGATYHFVSAVNRDQFLDDPEKYTPAFGGFCAFGVTRSVKITGDPNAWKIVNDKLYINSSPRVLGMWSEDIPGNINPIVA